MNDAGLNCGIIYAVGDREKNNSWGVCLYVAGAVFEITRGGLQDLATFCHRGFNFIYSGLKYIGIGVLCQLLTEVSGLL